MASLILATASGCAEAKRALEGDAGRWSPDDEEPNLGAGDGDDDFNSAPGNESPEELGDGDYAGDGDQDPGADGGPASEDIGAVLCALVGGCPAGGPLPPAQVDGGVPVNDPNDPNDTVVQGREPDPKNIKECPKHAPENPVGSCIGVPIYATCGYTTYNCICDWIHWICI